MGIAYNAYSKKVLEYITHYRDDVIIHDKQELENYKEDFISGYRRTGSDLLLLNKIEAAACWTKDARKSIEETMEWKHLAMERNEKFLLVTKDGKLKEIKIDKVKKYIDEVQSNAIRFYDNVFSKYNFELMTLRLLEIMTKHAWKKELIQLWRDNNLDIQIQQLNKVYGEKTLFKIVNKKMSKEEIKTALIDKFIELKTQQ